jgi:hypothetical protein
MKATQKIEDDLHDLAKGITDWKRFALSMIGSPRRALSQQVGNMCLSLFLPAVSSVFHSEEQCEMQFEIVKLGFALAAYRVDNGAYPEKLADLIPKYVTEVPKDIFNDADLHYQRDGDGYLLYSVGPNGKDDGGKTFEDSQKSDGLVKWDDIAIRIPAVGSTITEQANESKTAEGDDAPKE